MPQGDRTGPNGKGPMTGRKAGFCTGNKVAGFGNFGGAGFGRGRRAAGRGNRNMFFKTGHPRWRQFNDFQMEDEKETLKLQAEELKAQLELIESRLNQMNDEE